MGKRDTYCEVSFLRKFSEKFSQSSPFDEEQVRKNQCWIGLFKFLCSKAILMIDDRTQFNAASQENQLCHKIKKLWVNGSLQICEQKISIDAIPDDALCSSVLLYDDNPFVIQKAEKLGLLLITPSTYDQFACLYRDNGIAFRTNDIADWSILKQKCKHNFNAMIISDLYVLKERRINLYAILDALLPTSLDTEMHISIFTQDTPTFQQDCEEVKEQIKAMRPKLSFNLTLHKAMATDIHDRGIITNYMRIKCGAGFDLLKITKHGEQVARITTDVDVDFPYFIESEKAERSYENILMDAQKMYNNNICIGSKKHRLLK